MCGFRSWSITRSEIDFRHRGWKSEARNSNGYRSWLYWCNLSVSHETTEHFFSLRILDKNIGNPGSLCVRCDITQVNYREHMRRSLGQKICWKMEIKIDETYHVASFCCPLYVHVVLGKSSLHHLSFIVKWQGRRLKANSGSDRPIKARFFSRKSNPVAK